MAKQLIVITAPFNCPHCTRAMKELPSFCEENGWELVEFKNERKEDDFPVETYPTLMARVGEEVKETIKGYKMKALKSQLEKY